MKTYRSKPVIEHVCVVVVHTQQPHVLRWTSDSDGSKGLSSAAGPGGSH